MCRVQGPWLVYLLSSVSLVVIMKWNQIGQSSVPNVAKIFQQLINNFLTSFSECLRNYEGVMGIEPLAAIYKLI